MTVRAIRLTYYAESDKPRKTRQLTTILSFSKMKKQEHLQHLAATTNILWKLIKANGLNPGSLFEQGGIDPGLLNNPQARIACFKINTLWEIVSQKIPDACFAIHAGEHWHPSYLNALGYTWLVSSTLKESLEKLARYSKIISESTIVSLQVDKNELTIAFQYHSDGPFHPNRKVAKLSVLMEMCRINCGTDLNPLRIQFSNEYPVCMDPYQKYFRSDVIFNADCDSITFSNKDVHRLLPSANIQLAKINDQVIINHLKELDKGDIIQQVKTKITAVLSSGKITGDIIAEKLNMSVRTFQRKLQKKGTTFRSLLDETREDLARGYINDSSVRLEEISFLTGFSEYSSFSRAFKRWTGQSPSTIRSLI